MLSAIRVPAGQPKKTEEIFLDLIRRIKFIHPSTPLRMTDYLSYKEKTTNPKLKIKNCNSPFFKRRQWDF
jgi:hypothetical protein